MSRALGTYIAAAFRRTAIPLASYYAVTLGVPLANGAAQSGGPFFQHALVVLVVPPVCIVLAGLAYAIARGAVSGTKYWQPRATTSHEK